MERAFLYFLGGRPSVSRADIEAAGLAGVLDSEKVQMRHAAKGPGKSGHGGCVCAAAECKAEIGFWPDRQTWEPRGEGVHLGYDPNALPRPADLERVNAIGLYTVPLGDGQRWLLPTAILADGECALPKARQIGEDGGIVRRVQMRYEGLYLLADEVREAIKHQHPISTEKEWEICLAALGANYRLEQPELAVLCRHTDLLTDQAVQLIAWTLVDRVHWPDAQEALAAQE